MKALTQNQKYKAELNLSTFESIATNNMIADKLKAAGFTAVTVTGTGNTRKAEGIWAKPSTTNIALPKQVVSITQA